MLAAIAVVLLQSAGAGRSAALQVQAVSSAAPSPAKAGIVRTYYIAADEVNWDYTPQGRNIAGIPHGETTEDESGKG